MSDWLASNYLTLKSLRLISVVAWVGAQLTLPVPILAIMTLTHSQLAAGGQLAAGRQVIHFVVNPAMLVVLLMGISLGGSYDMVAARELAWLT